MEKQDIASVVDDYMRPSNYLLVMTRNRIENNSFARCTTIKDFVLQEINAEQEFVYRIFPKENVGVMDMVFDLNLNSHRNLQIVEIQYSSLIRVREDFRQNQNFPRIDYTNHIQNFFYTT